MNTKWHYSALCSLCAEQLCTQCVNNSLNVWITQGVITLHSTADTCHMPLLNGYIRRCRIGEHHSQFYAPARLIFQTILYSPWPHHQCLSAQLRKLTVLSPNLKTSPRSTDGPALKSSCWTTRLNQPRPGRRGRKLWSAVPSGTSRHYSWIISSLSGTWFMPMLLPSVKKSRAFKPSCKNLLAMPDSSSWLTTARSKMTSSNPTNEILISHWLLSEPPQHPKRYFSSC